MTATTTTTTTFAGKKVYAQLPFIPEYSSRVYIDETLNPGIPDFTVQLGSSLVTMGSSDPIVFNKRRKWHTIKICQYRNKRKLHEKLYSTIEFKAAILDTVGSTVTLEVKEHTTTYSPT